MSSTKKLNAFLKHPDASWAYYRMMKTSDIQEMDKQLVKIGHPLAHTPSTPWERFQALHKEGFQF